MEKPNIDIENIIEEPTTEEVVEEKAKRTRKSSKEKTANELTQDYEMEINSLPLRAGKTWKEVFIANYKGISEEAKEIQPFLKETYKGDVYIPWAVMERLVYMCDEDAKFTVINNANGGLVHSDMMINHQKNIQKGEVVSETDAPMFSHFVKIALEFMGKVFIEDYPIQDQDYSAARIYNQNLVNRAIQRGKTKLAARATGLGLKLYEGSDLQFDTKEEDKKPIIAEVKEQPKTTAKKEVTPVVETKVEVNVEEPKKVELTDEQKAQNIVDGGETEAYLNGERTFTTQDIPVNVDKDVMELVNIIKTADEEKMTNVLQKVNISVMKKYGFALSTKDSADQLIEKVSKFPDVPKFKSTIVALLG